MFPSFAQRGAAGTGVRSIVREDQLDGYDYPDRIGRKMQEKSPAGCAGRAAKALKKGCCG